MTSRTPSALPFSPPTALAPLDGVGRPTNLKAWAAVGGMGLLCAPFIRVSSKADPPWREPQMAAFTRRHGAMVHSVQLLGDEPLRMADAARALVARGVDIVDLNFGCPSKVILRKGAGAALLGQPARLVAVVRAVRDAVDVPVIAKIRLGVDRPEEALTLVPAIVAAGADLLAVHARTLADGYRPPARWDWLRRVVEVSDVPVLGNGDVWTAEDALRMRSRTGCAAVMIGRGALRNPWIFRQVAALSRGLPPPRPGLGDLHTFLRPLVAALLTEGEERQRLGPAKEVVAHVGLLLDDGGDWRRSALRTRDAAALLARVDALRDLDGVGLSWGPPTERSPSLP